MDLGLDGRVALVAGASSGIGKAIAAELVAEGAQVAIASRSRERIEAAKSEVGAAGAFVFDADEPEGAAKLVGEVEAALGGVEILICNTGGPPAGPDPLDFTREQWEAAYRSLVLTPIALVERVVPGMRDRSWGRILNVVSTTVREPAPVLVLSNAHRSATLATWKTFATTLAPDGITINSVLPGRIGTDRLGELFGSLENAANFAAGEVPAGRLGTVEEMAAAAAFLCSTRASYITGVSLLVDGGVTKAT